MSRVIIRGWRPGMNKIALDHLLRGRADLSLKQAKSTVDQVVAGQEVSIEVTDHETALALADAIDAVGAKCRVDATAFVR